MSMHLRNSRDMMTSEEADTPSFGKLRHVTDSENTSRASSLDTEDWGWWVSKTPLEQKLIILSSVLFVLSFCLTISVIVLDNRKPPACPLTTTVAPFTNDTTTDSNTTPPDTEPPTTEPPTTLPPTTVPPVTEPKKPKVKEDENRAPVDLKTTLEDSTEYFTGEEPSGRQV